MMSENLLLNYSLGCKRYFPFFLFLSLTGFLLLPLPPLPQLVFYNPSKKCVLFSKQHFVVVDSPRKLISTLFTLYSGLK